MLVITINYEGSIKRYTKKTRIGFSSKNNTINSYRKESIFGIICRICGDIRKIEDILKEDEFFNNIYNNFYYEDLTPNNINTEVIMSSNFNTLNKYVYSGIINNNHIAFEVEYSYIFWNILYLSIEEIEIFMQDKNFEIKDKKKRDFLDIVDRLKEIEKHSSIYVRAMYEQLNRIKYKYDTSVFLTKGERIAGFSFTEKSSITPKDFIVFYGGVEYKKILNDIMLVEKGFSGRLKIVIDVNIEQSMEIKNMIEESLVSSFRFFKKGFAWVDKMEVIV